jgi:hypothetical protein
MMGGLVAPGPHLENGRRRPEVARCDGFPSLAEYELYRAHFGADPDFIAADKLRDDTGCVVRYERTFLRPLLP